MHSFGKLFLQFFSGIALSLVAISSQAGLFDDDEARKAILELRQRVDVNKQSTDSVAQRQAEELKEINTGLRRSLLDLQSQIEVLRGEIAKSRGQEEQLTRDLAEVQRRQKDIAQGVDDRMRRFEPSKVSVDGREFTAEPAEKAAYDAAFVLLRKPDFPAAQGAFVDFLRRNPQSGYVPSALFWLGNAQYGNRDYQGAINNFRSMISQAPDHPKASEAALSIANCQLEIKDTRAARKTLEDLVKVYPQSEAAVAAKERLARMK